MPHALTAQDPADDGEDDDYRRLLQHAQDPRNFEEPSDLGEKADNAVDYGDLSDEDLADDEDENNIASLSVVRGVTNCGSFDDSGTQTQDENEPDLTGGSGPEGDMYDHLFNDDEGPSSPVDLTDADGGIQPIIQHDGANVSFNFDEDVPFTIPAEDLLNDSFQATHAAEQPKFLPVNFSSNDKALSAELQQRELFAMSGSGLGSSQFLPAPPENQEELLATLWPQFERNGVPNWTSMLPSRKARYIGKTPLKAPKPVQPTKVSLEIAADQAKDFTSNFGPSKRSFDDLEQPGLVVIRSASPEKTDADEEIDMDSDYENEVVGGATWQDLQIICADWDIAAPSSPNLMPLQNKTAGDEEDLFRDIDEKLNKQAEGHSAKVVHHKLLCSCIY